MRSLRTSSSSSSPSRWQCHERWVCPFMPGKPVDKPRVTKATLEEGANWIAEGSCLKCRKPGHTKRTFSHKGPAVSAGIALAETKSYEGRRAPHTLRTLNSDGSLLASSSYSESANFYYPLEPPNSDAQFSLQTGPLRTFYNLCEC